MSKMSTISTASNAPKLNGVYCLASSENVDEYLKGLGVGLVLRKVQAVARPNCVISHQSDTNLWRVVTESVFKTKEVTFKPMEKFEDETFDSRKCQSNVEILDHGKVLAWNQTCEEGPDVEATIISTESGFTWTMKSGELRCEFNFRRGLSLHQLQNNANGS